nr:hypothetical protein [Shewanella yunxiaonensis]
MVTKMLADGIGDLTQSKIEHVTIFKDGADIALLDQLNTQWTDIISVCRQRFGHVRHPYRPGLLD